MLVVRAASITAAARPLHLGAPRKLGSIALLTWGGLRGGVSVALALSLPYTAQRAPLVTACYGIVIFTMIVQGLTLEGVAGWIFRKEDA